MATTRRASNLKKPWAWLAALAALCLVLSSSTALYVLNPSVKLTLPWWTAIAAPAAIYALILPLCVPGLRAGGWLAGFGILALLHLALGATTAWLYSVVTFLPVRQFVASAFWSFPPALVLDMVGALVMTLPFLDALAPRPAAKKSVRPAAPKPVAADAKGRESWVRGSGRLRARDRGGHDGRRDHGGGCDDGGAETARGRTRASSRHPRRSRMARRSRVARGSRMARASTRASKRRRGSARPGGEAVEHQWRAVRDPRGYAHGTRDPG